MGHIYVSKETIIKRKLQQANIFHDVLCLEQRERKGYKDEKNIKLFIVYGDNWINDYTSKCKSYCKVGAGKNKLIYEDSKIKCSIKLG